MNWDLIVALIVNLVAIGTAYGGLRAEVRGLGKSVDEAKEAVRDAHRRIDDLFNRRRKIDE